MWRTRSGIRREFTYEAAVDYCAAADEGDVHIHDLHSTLRYLSGVERDQLTHRHSGNSKVTRM